MDEDDLEIYFLLFLSICLIALDRLEIYFLWFLSFCLIALDNILG